LLAVKLLIVAGPYEADRIRRAAVSAGIEAVAVEPGESLSGWINATRPQVIVLQPQVINADPVAALAKVRSVPRGRVPILLVGEAADEAQLRPLADGYFVRPIAADDLIAQARAAMGAAPQAVDDGGSGSGGQGGERGSDRTRAPSPSGPTGGPPGALPTLRPLVAGSESGPVSEPTPAREAPGGAVPESMSPARASLARGAVAASRPRRTSPGLDRLTETIDADIDADLAAELREVVREVGARRAIRSGAGPSPATAPALSTPSEPLAAEAAPGAGTGGAAPAVPDASDGSAELTDESSQKTREVPLVLPVSDRDEAIDRALVQARHALVLDGDYFQLLGVPRDAGADQVRRAHDVLRANLTPAALHPAVAAELGAELDEIRLVLEEARMLLENDHLRRQYREHLPAVAGLGGDTRA